MKSGIKGVSLGWSSCHWSIKPEFKKTNLHWLGFYLFWWDYSNERKDMSVLKKFWKQTLALFCAVFIIMTFLTGNVLCGLGSGVVVAFAYNMCLFLGGPE